MHENYNEIKVIADRLEHPFRAAADQKRFNDLSEGAEAWSELREFTKDLGKPESLSELVDTDDRYCANIMGEAAVHLNGLLKLLWVMDSYDEDQTKLHHASLYRAYVDIHKLAHVMMLASEDTRDYKPKKGTFDITPPAR